MSNEQPPRDDDQDVAEYQRADPSKFPTTPAGQQAAVEGMLAARGIHDLVDPDKVGPKLAARNRRKLAENITNDTALGRLQLDMLAAFEEFDRARRAEIIAAGGDPDDDDLAPLSRDYLVHIARAHRNATRIGGAALDGLLDQIAYDLDLYDVRIMRGAWAAITDAMPRIAHKARENGKSPDEIAQATGYTSSRVAQFIRQEKARRGPLTRYSWRIDTLDADGAWVNRETGEDEAAPADVIRLAERLLAETGAHGQRARVTLWEGDEATDDDALYSAESNGQWDAYWIVERWEGDHWYEVAAQSRHGAKDRPDALARYLLTGEQERQPEGARLRVSVWRFGESERAPLAQAATDQQ